MGRCRSGSEGVGDAEEIGTDVGEVFVESGDLNVLALNAKPEAALGEVEGHAEAEDEEDGSGPDKQGAAVFCYEEDGSCGGVVEGDGPLFVEAMGCLAYL